MTLVLRQITPATLGDLVSWHDKAVNTPHVRRFLGMDQYLHLEVKFESDWSEGHYLNDQGSTYLRVGIDRPGGNQLSLCVWSLTTNRFARALEVGRMLQEVPRLAKRYGARLLKTSVHATNQESMHLNIRRFGPPWGRQPEGAWDSEIGRFVDLVHFQRSCAG